MGDAQIQSQGAGLSQEYQLLDYLRRQARSRDGLIAVHIHLSRLRPYNRKPHHIRIALATFEAVVQNFEGQAFTLHNADLFFVCRHASVPEVDAAIMKVRHLFGIDPLAQGESEEDILRFATWYNLEVQFEEVAEMIQQFHRDVDRRARTGADSASRRMPITPRQLGELEKLLAKADLSKLLRRQPICALPAPNVAPKPMFREIFISIAEMQETLLPRIDMTSDLWLFQHLTETLDRRMLTMVTREIQNAELKSFSINLNLSTVLSPPFVNFDSSLKSVARGTVVIELQNIDIFSNMSGFLFARDYLRERSYRICLDGLNHQTLEFIDREKLGFDLLKLNWTMALVEDLSSRRTAELKSRIDEVGRTRVVLARCDSRDAIEFGHSMGISMFQGRYVDSLIQMKRARD